MGGARLPAPERDLAVLVRPGLRALTAWPRGEQNAAAACICPPRIWSFLPNRELVDFLHLTRGAYKGWKTGNLSKDTGLCP